MLIALLQAIVSGLAVGSAYALIALGFSITFTTTKTLNFSHGDFVSVGAFIGVSILWLLLGKPIDSPLTGVSIATWQQLVAALGSVFVIGCLGVLLYFLAVRPFAGKPGMSWVMSTIGFGSHPHEPRSGDLGALADCRPGLRWVTTLSDLRRRRQATGDPHVRGRRDHHDCHRRHYAPDHGRKAMRAVAHAIGGSQA